MPPTSTQPPEAILLSRTGSDRATGYVMSNKIVRHAGSWYVTWLESDRQIAWARVAGGEMPRLCMLGQGIDNHCGAAIALDGRGGVHCVLGGHHSPLLYRHLPSLAGPKGWGPAQEVAPDGTYPGIAADLNGTLHLTYRCMNQGPWTLNYRRRERSGKWSDIRPLVTAAKRGYVYWTNSSMVGTDNDLHLTFGVSIARPDGSIHLGAAHLLSNDGGHRWTQLGGDPLETPVPAESLQRIESDSFDPDRRLPPERIEGSPPGPTNFNYLQIHLSNLVLDAVDRPNVILHNGLNGTAALYTGSRSGSWTKCDLTETVQQKLPGWKIHVQSSLSRRSDCLLEAALMAQPKGEQLWGEPGTRLVRLVLDSQGQCVSSHLVEEGHAPDQAQWLPSLEQWDPHAPLDRPALTFTVGRNAGGFSQNFNDERTEVWFVPPETEG